MATENQRVVAYLSHDEMAELKSLSESWGLSLSKTIARAVREVGTLKPTGVATIAGGLSEHEVTTLIDDKVDTLRNELQGSLGKLREGDVLAITNLEKEIAAINARLDKLERKDDGLPPVGATEPLQPIVEGASASLVVTKTVEDELPPLDCPDGWDASQLVLRLKDVNSPQTINNKRNRPDFPQWSKSKDPDGYAWENRLPEGKKKKALFPIIPD